MKIFSKYFVGWIFLATVCAGAYFSAQAKMPSQHIVDSLWRELSLTHTPADSIRLLYNIYDATSARMSTDEAHDRTIQILNQLYDVAMRAKDTVSAYDAMRYQSTVSRYDIPYVDMQLQNLNRMPNTTAKQETETFLKIQRYFWVLRDTTATEEQRRQNFYKIRSDIEKNRGSKTLYNRLDQQFALVLYGSNFIQADQLDKYLMDLRRFVEMADDPNSILKSYYYRVAALLYDENDNGQKAVDADYKLLKILDEKDKEHRRNGRLYKNYDNLRFMSYRRLLGNYDYLPKDSVEPTYRRVRQLMEQLPPNELNEVERLTVDAMWNMYKRNYKDALKALRVVVTSKRYRDKPNYILAYIKAASAVDSYEDLTRGQRMFSDLLMKRAREAADTEYARMRIEYEIDTLEASTKSAEKYAEAAGKKTEMVSNEYFYYGLIALGLFLLAIIILQVIANRRTRRMADRLTISNEELKKERDTLRATKAELEKANEKAKAAARQKAEFVHNVSHEISEPVKAIVGFTQLVTDSIPEERRKYMARFIDIINHNSNILQRIVGDILDTAEIDDTVTNITVTHFNPERVCELVANNFSPRLKPGQEIVVEPLKIIGSNPYDDASDVGIDTDAERLEQILLNIISNAVKFSEEGVIRITPVVDFDRGELEIAVTDHGPGIPAGKEEVIFDRFEKLGHYANGLGLGLFVSRELARLLEGTVKVDPDYRNGARFIITLPISIRPQRID